ncbi:MAG: T9SS type A sorting domain-containing protein [Fibrobacteres bacterium]|nr:T9SS type A sorting domain-containing protein [Fibrobacterota bacterium]
MKIKTALATIVAAVLLASPIYSITALPTVIAVESGDSTDAIPLFKGVDHTVQGIVPAVVSAPKHGTVTLITAKSTYWKKYRPDTTAAYKGALGYRKIPVTWFRYTPSTAFTGVDSFTYNVAESGGATSNTVTCIVKVRPKTATGQTILLLVNDSLKNSLASEIGRLKSDLDSEGYTAQVKYFKDSLNRANALLISSNTVALSAWRSIREEFMKSDRIVTGAILIGYVPPIAAVFASDDGFWNMSLPVTDWYADTMWAQLGDSTFSKDDTINGGYDCDAYLKGGSLRHIWVSRMYTLAGSGRGNTVYGTEVDLMKRVLDNNHNYRKGLSRYPHRAVSFDMSRLTTLSMARYLPIWQDTVKISNANNAGRVIVAPGDTIFKTLLPYTPGYGAEIWDINSHGNTNFLNPTAGYSYARSDTLMKRPFQTRFAFLSACHTSYPGNFTNQQIYTRGGGCVLSVGTCDYVHYGGWYSIVNSQPSSVKMASMIAAGSNWGNAWLASDMPLGFNYFYGDLSLKPKMGPSNAMPIIDSLVKSAPSAGRVKLTAENARDPDGSITTYEWWFKRSYSYGASEPDTVTTVNSIEIEASRIVDSTLRVEIIDNYMARSTATIGSRYHVDAEAQNSFVKTVKGVLTATPNPFNGVSSISVNLENNTKISLSVYDLAGRQIQRIASGNFRSGNHTFIWNSRNSKGTLVPPGTYIYRLNADGKLFSVKNVLIR